MTTLRAGQDIASYCGKCKLELMHIIHAVGANGKPAKVECRTCGAVHGYRVKGAKKGSTTTRTKRTTTARKTKADKAKEEAMATYEQLLHGRSDEPAVPYSIMTTFEEKSLIAHKKFGTGVVIEVIAGGKISVVFLSGTLTLVHGRGK